MPLWHSWSNLHMQNTRICQLCQALLYCEDTDLDFGAGNVFTVFALNMMLSTLYSSTLLSYSLWQGCSCSCRFHQVPLILYLSFCTVRGDFIRFVVIRNCFSSVSHQVRTNYNLKQAKSKHTSKPTYSAERNFTVIKRYQEIPKYLVQIWYISLSTVRYQMYGGNMVHPQRL